MRVVVLKSQTLPNWLCADPRPRQECFNRLFFRHPKV